MIRRFFLWAILGMVLGSIFGFAGAWASRHSASGGEDFWSSLFALPAFPGTIITWGTHGGYDWGVGEDWDYRVPITIWNGFFWAVFFAGISMLKSWRFRSKN